MAKTTTKHGQISKANSRIMVIVSVATVIAVFCLVSSKTLLNEGAYQRRLLSARHKTVAQLQTNQKATQTLLDQYNNVFENSGATNVIGGSNDSSPSAVPPNGDNSRIILDALPTGYDFPGLISSVAKILASDNITSPTIGGTDQSASADNTSSSTTKPISIKLTVSGQGTYANIQSAVKDLERSIRPFDVNSIQINGTSDSMTMSLNMTTYYQPSKTLEPGIMKVK